jgi:hypothetical protein
MALATDKNLDADLNLFIYVYHVASRVYCILVHLAIVAE